MDFCTPRLSWQSCRIAPTCSDGVSIIAVMIGSSIFSIRPGIRQLRRAVDLLHHAVRGGHAVENARRRRDEIHAEFPLEPLLDDLHVEQSQEPAPEPESERRGRLGLEEERGVVEPQLLERVAQLRILASLDRIEPGEHHRLAHLEPGERFRGPPRRLGDGVADLRVGDGLDPGEDEPDLADAELGRNGRLWRERADLIDVVLLPLGHQPDLHAGADRAVDDARQDDDAAIRVVPGIENQGLQGRIRITDRRRQALDDRLEDLVDARALFRAREHRRRSRRGRRSPRSDASLRPAARPADRSC